MSEITNLSNFAASVSKRQQHVMSLLMYLFLYFLTLFTPLSSPTPTAPPAPPTCYEPTSGPYGKPLSAAACLSIANIIDTKFPDITLDLTHGPPIFWDWVQCPLAMEQGGCYFRMDYSRPPKLQSVPLECSRDFIVSAILYITSQCVLKNNVDGGEYVHRISDGSSVSFFLTHPPTTLGSVNRTSMEVVGGDSNFLPGPAKQGSTGTS